MKLSVRFTLIIMVAILFSLGCGEDDTTDDASSSPTTEALGGIKGRVIDGNGNPVSGAIVTTEPQTSQVITAADGSFEMPTIANGNYTVWAQSRDMEGRAFVSVQGRIAVADIRLTEEIRPKITIIDSPEAATSNRDVTFSWTGRHVSDFSYKLDDQVWSEWGKKTEKTYHNLAQGLHTFSVKGRDDKGQESEIVTQTFTIADLPPITIEITFPKSNDKVEHRTTVTGKLLGVKDRRELKGRLNLNPDAALKIQLWVWDANDPHGPWLQPPATIGNNLQWVEDEPAWFGRPGDVDVGKTFKVKAELVKPQADQFILIQGVEPVTIADVIRK